MVEADRIELPMPVKEQIYSLVQPTNSCLTSKIWSSVVRFELTLSTSTYSTVRIIQRKMGLLIGFEPTTRCLQGTCSTVGATEANLNKTHLVGFIIQLLSTII